MPTDDGLDLHSNGRTSGRPDRPGRPDLMPRYRKGEARKARRLWLDALPAALAAARHRANEPDGGIPDAVLLGEAEHHFGPGSSENWGGDLWGPERWFDARLLGAADSSEVRESLAAALRKEVDDRRVRGAGHRPWGLLTWPAIGHRSRRGDPPRPPTGTS